MGEDVTISLSQTTIYLPVGQSQKVTATASDGKAVTWVSLTSGVASVDSAGNITGSCRGIGYGAGQICRRQCGGQL